MATSLEFKQQIIEAVNAQEFDPMNIHKMIQEYACEVAKEKFEQITLANAVGRLRQERPEECETITRLFGPETTSE